MALADPSPRRRWTAGPTIVGADDLERTTPVDRTDPSGALLTRLVQVDDLVITYAQGLVTAVNGLSLTVDAGEVLGLLGGNGAGKTSTMRALAGITPATSGRILVAGHDLSVPADADRARQVLGYCPDTAGVIRQGTVREHIGLALGLHGRLEDWSYALDLVTQFGLVDVLDRETTGFSHGMSRRLSVLLAALTAQQVLILDEPFDGVDPLGVAATEAVIRRARDAGLAVLVSTHMIDLLTKVSSRVNVLVGGRIVDEATAAQFTGDTGRSRYERLLEAAA